MSYAHLHLHTHYSLLDGATKIPDLMKRVADTGMPAAAMTDHGNMFGAVEFYRAARQAGVKPIIGCEVYVAPRSRKERSPVVADDYERAGNYHLILLAMNEEGYRNLCRLVSQSYIDGFYYKPRIDKELLRELNRGLICLSGCLAGELASAVTAGRYDIARRVIEEYARLFGDRYYLEIQDNHLPEQEQVNRFLIEIAPEVGIPLVATNDCHYLDHADAQAHEVLLCVQTGKSMSDESRWRFGTDQLYVKTPEEMLRAFAEVPEAVRASVEIAERCDLELSFGRHQFPVYQTPANQSLDDFLCEQARKGLARRLAIRRQREPDLDEEVYRARLEEELRTIIDMDFAGYFLIVADFVGYAREQGIPVGPGRGSAAGSLVSYALGITDIDPIRYNLLFERFLNPERITMPDIDVDFCFERRDEVLDYVRRKYGHDRVANIITFNVLKGKQAIRDVGRALDFSFAETDRICKLYPAAKQGKDYSLAEALELEPRLRELRDSGDRERKLFEYALKLEGLTRHVSKHAAGIVISDKPLIEQVPLFVDKDGTVVTQFAGPDIEAIGLIKFDFLGLKTLTQIADTLKLIEEQRGEKVDLSNLPLDDPAVYRLLSRADTIGVFQMESGGMRKLLTRIRPSCFEDLIAVLALFRPGPLDSGMAEQYVKRKNGEEVVRYPDEALRSILAETYGVIVYQEQVMQIAQVYAGYTLGEADILRRAMGKKKREVMEVERARFIERAVERGHARAVAEQIFQQIETFAAYGFNKSHSAAYALVSYQTAYLKAHYPTEFFAALLSHEMDDTDKVYKNLADCRQHGIRVLPPDVNHSRAEFTVCPEGIRFGLGAVKGVGEKAIEAIVEARREGPFRSLADFCLRVDSAHLNRRMIEGLIKAGAFDSIDPNRARLLAGVETAMAWAARVQADKEAGQMGLFAGQQGESQPEPELPDVPPWDTASRLQAEHEVVGLYISGHPLDRHVDDLRLLGAVSVGDLESRGDQETVRVAGVTNTVRLKNNRRGDRYATFNLEDLEGVVEVIAWPEVYRRCEAAIVGREPVLVVGKLELGDAPRQRHMIPEEEDEIESAAAAPVGVKPQIIAEDIVPLVEARRRTARVVDLRVRTDIHDEHAIPRLRRALERFPGHCPAVLHVVRPGESETTIRLPEELSIDPSDGFLREMEALLGPGNTTVR
ncbi:MAG: DNA polymerase III subunit alpha [Candidatus Dadabacteria bacterium]|nr:MAG: DNA polymerase III subunit alpha [Candidatus Dadabacteria bacterium]